MSTIQARVRRLSVAWRLPTVLPVAVGLGAALTVAVGLVIQNRSPGSLGTPLPPFLMNWAPVLRWPAVIAVVVCLGGAALAPRLISSLRPPAAFAAAAYAAALAAGLSLNAGRLGTAGWDHVFDRGPGGSFDAGREYLPALRELRLGVHHYVHHFAQLLPYLPTHAKGNPPGPVVAMHLLGITTAGRLTTVCIALGALTSPLAYALGRSLGGERRGREAAALTVFCPALLLFGVTSVDYVFAALGTAIAWLLVSRRAGARVAGCGLAAIGSFSSWLLLALPVWAALVVWRRDGPRAATRTALAAAAAVIAFNLALVALLGYDPIAVLRALGPIYAHGIAAHRPYAFWLFGSPVAWLVMLGAPVVWLWCRHLGRGDAAALALGVVIVTASLAGFTKAETERIWLPFAGLACVAAAASPVRRLGPVLLSLAGQALVVQLLFNTIW